MTNQFRKCVLTLSNGAKVVAEISLSTPPSNKPMFHEEMERKAIEEINRSQPYAVNKVVDIHIMRN
jgi:hypothetical protein